MGIFDQLANIAQTPPVASPEPSKKPVAVTTDEEPQPTNKPTVKRPTRVNQRPEANPKLPLDRPTNRQRIITRASFEVYQDQIQVFRQISLQAKLTGDNLSISEMVREALDSYLTDKNIKP